MCPDITYDKNLDRSVENIIFKYLMNLDNMDTVAGKCGELHKFSRKIIMQKKNPYLVYQKKLKKFLYLKLKMN